MFRDVPECSGVFHVPAFIDDRALSVACQHLCSGYHENLTVAMTTLIPPEMCRRFDLKIGVITVRRADISAK